jgi:hypothetical protein
MRALLQTQQFETLVLQQYFLQGLQKDFFVLLEGLILCLIHF